MENNSSTPVHNARSTRAARSREESFKRWLAVLIAFVTLLVGLTSFLQADSSARNARLTRLAQESAISSTGLRTRGQQQYAFSEYVVVREYDELRSQATYLSTNGDKAAASAYLTASQEITPLSPLLGPAYATPRASDGWLLPDDDRYQVDSWVVTSTLLSERREAAANEANAWDGKSNNFVAAIAVFAVSLFLFGLASTLSGFVRWLFLIVGLALTAITMLWVIGTALLPVHHIPDRALERFAYASGQDWQGNYTDAIKAYSEAIQADRDYANAYSARGFDHLKEEPPKLDEAIKDFQTALDKGSDKYEVYWNLGWAYYLVGDYDKSILYSVKALDINSKVCGPAFNIAIARLASGNVAETDKAYGAAIGRCEKILDESLKVGLAAPYSLWTSMQGAVDDIEDLLCQTHHQYCYDNRDKPTVGRVRDLNTVKTLGEKYHKRLKEALTALEFQHTSKVTPSGAHVEELLFGSRVLDEKNEFQSYIMRERFPDDRRDLYVLYNYKNMSKRIRTIYKVFYNGREETGMRYDEMWPLETEGTAKKKLNYRFTMRPGHYDVELYGNGELLARGSFDLDSRAPLPVSLPTNARPSAPVSVGNLLFADDFENNNHGWWSGLIDRVQEGKIEHSEYLITTHEKDGYWRVTCEYCYDFDNFYYEVNTRYIRGPTNWGYGLTIRSDRAMSALYLFLINADGQFSIYKIGNKTATPLVSWTTNSAVRKQGTNRLGVLARGSNLEFYISGQLMRRVTDSTYAKGYFGMAVERTDLQAAFSELRVWQAR